MAPITEDAIRELAAFKGHQAPVTSCYLDVDGSRLVRQKDIDLHLDALLRRARNGHAHQADQSVGRDLKRIEDHVKGGLDRKGVRGLAMFSCSAHGLWRVFELPVAVRSQLVVNDTAHVRQLEAVLDSYERFGVLLADRQRARMFVFELGRLVDKSELFDQLPRGEDEAGGRDRGHEQRDHAQEVARHHLKRAAQVAFQAFQDQAFDHLIIGAPDDIARELEGELHPYLRERTAARLDVAIAASEDQIRQAALGVEEGVERDKDAQFVARLRDAVGVGSGGVTGLDRTLGALVERRVDTLLVSDGFVAPGWRCRSCRWVGVKGRSCPVCGQPMAKVDDVVEEAVEDALVQSCKVRTVRENADLDVLGRIGALLRY